MHRLHRTLLRLGVDSKILVLEDEGTAPDVSRLPRIESLSIERRVRALTGRLGLNDVHRLGSFRLGSHTFFQNADLVHFHGMHSGTFSYLALPRLAAAKPIVFTLHDAWAFTGHCAYCYECERWKTGCGDCPRLEEEPSVRRDATRLEWRAKSRAFLKSRVRLVSKSSWTTRMARVSRLRHLPLVEIPCGVDSGVYRPRGRGRSRELLGLPQDGFILLVAARDLSLHRSGTDLLVRALQALRPDVAARCVLMAMGEHGSDLLHGSGLPVRDLGYVEDDHLKAVAYSAADLYVLPRRASALGLSAIESQACGTPVACFRVGGLPDYVRPGETGFLAEPEDALGLRDGISLLLENEAARLRMSEACRASVLQEYDVSLEAARHAGLYESALAEAAGNQVAPYPVLVPPAAQTGNAPTLHEGTQPSPAGQRTPLVASGMESD